MDGYLRSLTPSTSQDAPGWEDHPFLARLTTVYTLTNSDVSTLGSVWYGMAPGTNLYGVVEQSFNQTAGTPVDSPGGRQTTFSGAFPIKGFALEENNQLVTVPSSIPAGYPNPGPYVRMQLKGIVGGAPCFEFSFGSATWGFISVEVGTQSQTVTTSSNYSAKVFPAQVWANYPARLSFGEFADVWIATGEIGWCLDKTDSVSSVAATVPGATLDNGGYPPGRVVAAQIVDHDAYGNPIFAYEEAYTVYTGADNAPFLITTGNGASNPDGLIGSIVLIPNGTGSSLLFTNGSDSSSSSPPPPAGAIGSLSIGPVFNVTKPIGSPVTGPIAVFAINGDTNGSDNTFTNTVAYGLYDSSGNLLPGQTVGIPVSDAFGDSWTLFFTGGILTEVVNDGSSTLNGSGVNLDCGSYW